MASLRPARPLLAALGLACSQQPIVYEGEAEAEAEAEGEPPAGTTPNTPAIACDDLPVTPADLVGTPPVALFWGDNLPVISLEIDETNWETVCANGRDTYEDARAGVSHDHVWAEADFSLGPERLDRVGLRFLGRSTVAKLFREDPEGDQRRCEAALAADSRRFDPDSEQGAFRIKPSFKIAFPEHVRGQEFHGLRRVNLVGDTGRETLLDEWLPNRVFEQAGQPHVRTGHAALCINGTYRGLYMIEEQADDQAWLDTHAGGLEPRTGDDGPYTGAAFYKVDGYGPLAYESDDRCRYRLRYEPRAGTADPGEPADADDLEGCAETGEPEDAMRDLMALLRWASFSSDDAFFAEAEQKIDLDNWLTVLAIELILGDVDGLHANGNNYLLFHEANEPWRVARFDPDSELYWWDSKRGGAFAPWWSPGIDVTRGPRLLCVYPTWNPNEPNCDNGAAPLDGPEETIAQIRHPVLTARLLYVFQTQFLDKVEELLAGPLAERPLLDVVRARAGLIERWMAADPWASEHWTYQVHGDGEADGDCVESAGSSRAVDCKLLDALYVYLTTSAAQAARLRDDGRTACPRNGAEHECP